ncbi:MAG: formate dehydrogenase accessory sulfurtransferase FdhD [Chloroflexota bacterium]|nr:formate dehydrogenase accessory sulfurtransferase FdhD [Chloroflexota bacterium]
MDGSFEWQITRWDGESKHSVEGAVIEEQQFRIHVNGRNLATIMCTPVELEALTLGFLRSEGIIQGMADIQILHLCPGATCIDVWLREADATLPREAILTSGCGGGVTFDDMSQLVAPLDRSRVVSREDILSGMRRLLDGARLYRVTRGVHTSSLDNGNRVRVICEDVGRHNTIDKLWGTCLKKGINPAGLTLFATGRISSEMLNKAAKMRVPAVVSLTSPTSLSVQLAQHWQMLLVGYVRSTGFNVYAGDFRLI